MISDWYVTITIGGWRILVIRGIVAEAINQWLEHAQAHATCCQKTCIL